MVAGPKPDPWSSDSSNNPSLQLQYVYDSWNRQVAVKSYDATQPTQPAVMIATYQFDGLNRRIAKTLANGTKTDYFYNENWQVLEEQTRSASGTLTLTNQYVWDISYIDSPIARMTTSQGYP